MPDSLPSFEAFDPAALRDSFARQFGWGETEMLRAAEALMPAAIAGMRRFASSPDGFEGLMALFPGPARFAAGADPKAFLGEPLALIFGPADTQKAIARYVAGQTGLELPGVETMMPVVATLALGQMARRFTVGPARDLLDAFLAGYARGRPKPIPNPLQAMAPYTEAMRAFWDGYTGLFPAAGGAASQPEPAEAETPDASESETEGTQEPGLLDAWIGLGRDIQDSQVRSFEVLYDKLAEKQD